MTQRFTMYSFCLRTYRMLSTLTSFWFSLDQKDQVPGVPRIGLQSQSEQ